MERRLAAILAADVVSYSRLMGEGEVETHARVKSILGGLVGPKVAGHGGRVVKEMGDGVLAEFPSVVEAVRCAAAIQLAMGERADEGNRTIRLRIGVNLGDIIVDDGDIFGDGVNVAARLEGLADPGGVCISAAAHDAVEGKLDLAFEDMGAIKMKNIARPVRVHRLLNVQGDTARAPGPPLPGAPDKPSIAVLPFQNMSHDPDDAFFSDGISEEINTELSRYDELLVIARNSTAAYDAAPQDFGRISTELGVRHILTGSVRRAGKRVRITARLVDARSGAQLWADRFDRDMEDIFEVQDEITAVIVNTLLGKIAHTEYERSLHKRPETLDAYDHALRASVLLTDWDIADNAHARQEAEQAIVLDPGFARAHAFVAWTFSLEAILRWVPDPDTSFARAYEIALHAVELDEAEPWAYASLGVSQLWGRREYARGLASLRRAIALNPNNANFRVWLSNGLCLAGQSDEGLAEVEHAIRLNPMHPPIYLHFLARILATLGRHEEALVHLDRLARVMPTSTNSLALYAACNVATGRDAEARAAVTKLLSISPGFSLSIVPEASPYARREDLDGYLDLLRRAGLPE